MRSVTSASDRFWVKVDTSGECWEWAASKFRTGYGQFTINGHPVSAHRFAYMDTFGPIPHGLMVRHSCDNRLCCNPRHLSLGTAQDNMDDKVSRGRQYRPPKRYDVELLVGLTFREANVAFGISEKQFYRLKKEALQNGIQWKP